MPPMSSSNADDGEIGTRRGASGGAGWRSHAGTSGVAIFAAGAAAAAPGKRSAGDLQ